MSDFAYLGQELSRLRQSRNVSSAVLAEHCGVREVTIKNLEAGRFFNPALLNDVLNFFNCRLTIKPRQELADVSSFADTEATLFNFTTKASRKPTCIEICAGAGGQALGLEQAGFEHVVLVEYEKEYCDALQNNRPQWNIICGDVKNFSGLPYRGKIDLLAGGVPCPPFSVAGKQLGSEDERDLFPEALRLIQEINPKAIMLENVRGFLDPVFASYRENILSQIRRFGYNVQIKLLHASDYGVSQLRPRVVIVGIRNDLKAMFSYPEPLECETPTVGSVLLDLMKANHWQGADDWAKNASKIAPTIVGGSKKHGGPDLGPARARRAWAELGVNGLGVADEAPAHDFVGMPKLTPRMIARIQGFPDDWLFASGKTKACRMIGNAFPPPVAMAVGKQIRKILEQQ